MEPPARKRRAGDARPETVEPGLAQDPALTWDSPGIRDALMRAPFEAAFYERMRLLNRESLAEPAPGRGDLGPAGFGRVQRILQSEQERVRREFLRQTPGWEAMGLGEFQNALSRFTPTVPIDLSHIDAEIIDMYEFRQFSLIIEALRAGAFPSLRFLKIRGIIRPGDMPLTMRVLLDVLPRLQTLDLDIGHVRNPSPEIVPVPINTRTLSRLQNLRIHRANLSFLFSPGTGMLPNLQFLKVGFEKFNMFPAGFGTPRPEFDGDIARVAPRLLHFHWELNAENSAEFCRLLLPSSIISIHLESGTGDAWSKSSEYLEAALAHLEATGISLNVQCLSSWLMIDSKHRIPFQLDPKKWPSLEKLRFRSNQSSLFSRITTPMRVVVHLPSYFRSHSESLPHLTTLFDHWKGRARTFILYQLYMTAEQLAAYEEELAPLWQGELIVADFRDASKFPYNTWMPDRGEHGR